MPVYGHDGGPWVSTVEKPSGPPTCDHVPHNDTTNSAIGFAKPGTFGFRARGDSDVTRRHQRVRFDFHEVHAGRSLSNTGWRTSVAVRPDVSRESIRATLGRRFGSGAPHQVRGGWRSRRLLYSLGQHSAFVNPGDVDRNLLLEWWFPRGFSGFLQRTLQPCDLRSKAILQEFQCFLEKNDFHPHCLLRWDAFFLVYKSLFWGYKRPQLFLRWDTKVFFWEYKMIFSGYKNLFLTFSEVKGVSSII